MINPGSLLLALAEHDHRICFAFNITKNSFVYLNPAFDALFKLPHQEVTPKLLYSMVHPDDLGYLKTIYQNLQPNVFTDNIEFRLTFPEGKECTIRLSMFLGIFENQEHVATGYMEDITAMKLNEEKGRELGSKKNAILNIISHDLAGPLGSIKNFAFLLSKKTKDLEDEQVNKFINSIETLSNRSILLIQEFIRQEFIETVGVDVVKIRLNLVEKFKIFMQEYYSTENDTGKNFNFYSSHPQIYAEVDENKFMQVINNLISNSLKFTPDGGTISLSIEQKNGTVIISVGDNGVGIPKKFHDKLFEKFSESRRTGLKGEPSVGLGMSIIKTIVEWHHGRIWFESEENKGSTFFIELPGSDIRSS
ncbi:sensor histidine kinase [Pedobacter immunditicola]|uniref:sensor histidine kinase n=1 Tax=Pedobacter immunditicola TaxID=3133440 RepID=UPI00309FB6E8